MRIIIFAGEIKDVEGTLYDLRRSPDLYNLLQQFPAGPNGYDINFCIKQTAGENLNLVGR